MKITILGCGASSGVPLIGCSCSVCTSSDAKNKRTRPSILISKGNTSLLVDTSPDLRQQALANKIKEVDAILITHAHADHTHGIDDVRSFNFYKNQNINLYSDSNTLSELVQRFNYIFKPHIPEYGWFRPALTPNELLPEQQEAVRISDELELTPFRQIHGQQYSTGIRVGNMVYSTDVNSIDDAMANRLEGMDLWIVDCLRVAPAPTHAHLEMTLSWIERFKPKRAVLTHLSHDFDYRKLKSELPDGVEPAYDGMEIEL